MQYINKNNKQIIILDDNEELCITNRQGNCITVKNLANTLNIHKENLNSNDVVPNTKGLYGILNDDLSLLAKVNFADLQCQSGFDDDSIEHAYNAYQKVIHSHSKNKPF